MKVETPQYGLQRKAQELKKIQQISNFPKIHRQQQQKQTARDGYSL